MTVDICYVISHGFSARMVLHSRLIPELRERGISVAVVSPDAEEPTMLALAEELDITAAAPPPPRSIAEAVLFKRFQQYFFEDVEGNAALRAKHLRDLASSEGRPLRRAVPMTLIAINRLSRRFDRLPQVLDRLQQQLLRSRAVERLLHRLQPRLIVSTYPVNFLEAAFIHEGRRAGIPTVGQLLSWDNITCKGRFPATADYYLSWGPVMTGELRDYYMVEPGDIVECGVPHFDEHTRPRTPAEMGDLLRGLALSPDHPYLFFGMSSPYFAPREIDIVEWLAAKVERGELGDGLQMVVRPHPQNMTGWMSDQSWKGRLQALEGKRVAVDYPSVEPSRLSWNMQRADLAHLARLISGCTVSINSGSTLSIDAIVQDKPVILSCFDAADELPWWESARRVLEYPHLAKLVALGGVYPTRSLDELAVAITAYLADPSLHADGRARTRREECGECDGQASRRSAAALAGLVHRGSTAQARA